MKEIKQLKEQFINKKIPKANLAQLSNNLQVNKIEEEKENIVKEQYDMIRAKFLVSYEVVQILMNHLDSSITK